MNKKKVRYSHATLVEALRKYVEAQKPGDMLDNDKVLSARFGVSNVTLRAAMLDLVKEGRVFRRVGVGTIVLDISIHQYIAVVIPQQLLKNHQEPFSRNALMSVLDILNQREIPYKLFMVPRIADEKGWLSETGLQRSGLTSAVEKKEIRAVVNINIGLDAKDWAKPLLERGVPIVGITTDRNTPYRVTTNEGDNIRQAVRYLSNFGRTRLAFLSWNQPTLRLCGESTTLDVFQEALRQSELTYYPEWTRAEVDPNDDSKAWHAFHEIWTASADQKPDGLVITDDRLFSGVTSLILEAGIRVPRDLQIVTHWNKDSGVLCPFPVARYEIDGSKAGAMVDEMLQAKLKDSNYPPVVKYLEVDWFTEGQYDYLHDVSLPRLTRQDAPY